MCFLLPKFILLQLLGEIMFACLLTIMHFVVLLVVAGTGLSFKLPV